MTSLEVTNIFEKNITYVSYARSGVEYYTNDLIEVNELYNNGWTFNPYYDGFRMIPPEECIVDITNYQKALQYANLDFNLLYYDYLVSLVSKNRLNYFIDSIIQEKNIFYKNFKYLVSYGPILENEIRISGSDKRIKNLKMDMANKFANSNDYINLKYSFEKEIKLKKRLVEHTIALEKRSNKEQNFFNEINEKIKLIKNVNSYNEKIFEILNLEVIDFNKIDVILFIPFGCFKYLSSFVNPKIIDKIMFLEVHIEKTKGNSFELFKKTIKGKNVLIIDNMYSGKTIKKTKEIIDKEGGNSIVLGLNPKNKNNIINSDYVMILNTILKSDTLNLKEKSFFRDMYIEILKEN